MSLPDLVRELRIDTTPLRTSRDFRLLFSAGVVSYLGSMITYVALPFQVKELTDSYVAVGALGLVELVPLVVFGLWGGALADAIDRRRMVVFTELGLGVDLVDPAGELTGREPPAVGHLRRRGPRGLAWTRLQRPEPRLT